MKTLKLISLLLIISLFASNCNKRTDPIEEDETIESVNDLVVPPDFEWNTTKTVSVTVSLPSYGQLQPLIITTRDGSKRYFRGFPDDGSRTIRTKITIPTYINELKLSYNGTMGPNMVFLSNETLAYNYNITTKSTQEPCDCIGGVTALSLKYMGTVDDVTIRVYKDKVEPNKLIAEFENVSINDIISFVGDGPDNKLGAKTRLTINGNDSDYTEIHTSCSEDIYIGMNFGVYKVTAGSSRDGGDFCELGDCNLNGMVTYSKGGWGQKASGNNVGALRDQYFDQVYPNDFVIGNASQYTITFTESKKVKDYLPGGGAPKVLTRDWTNPKKHEKQGNMADQIIAARLNRDYNNAGVLGSNPDYTLGELVFQDGPFENMAVNDFLVMAEIALGGGSMSGFTASEYATAAENINLSFHEGDDEDILTCPVDPEEDDPFVVVSSSCSDPDVIFTITNTGDGDMTSEYEYTLYKNDVEIGDGEYELDVNQTFTLTQEAEFTDEFRLVVETPREETLEEEISGCGSDGENPSEQLSGTLAYEDLWPGKGDYDFNDLVVDYEFKIEKNGQEVVQSITATFVIKAFGASLHNGFGITFPTVEPNDIVSVSGYDVINTTVFNMAGNGLEVGQSKATIIVFDDVRRIMPQTTGGIGVNTQLEYDYIDPVTIVLEITFADDAITFNDLNIGTFNPFLIVNTIENGVPGERGLEIHLPNYLPSDLFDDSYLGQFEDNSSVADGRYFVTVDNLPWAINIAEEFDWVIEFQDITGAYLMFAEWAESGGINYADWYQDNSGYRNSSLIYPTQIGN